LFSFITQKSEGQQRREQESKRADEKRGEVEIRTRGEERGVWE
jgi:hypothetical protein